MVPWPSGMRAVGDGDAVRPLLERTRVTASGWRGVGGAVLAGSEVGDVVVVGEVAATEAAGVTGFIRSPLSTVGAESGEAALDVGAGGRTFSRWACR